MKRLRETDRAIVLQSRLKQRDVKPRESRAGAVQRMAEAVLSVLSLETQVHPAGLKIAKV